MFSWFEATCFLPLLGSWLDSRRDGQAKFTYSGETVTLWLSRPTDLAKSSALRAPCSGGAGGAIVSGAGNAGGTDGGGRASQDLVLSRASAREREGDHSAWLVPRRDGRPLTAPKWTQASRPTALFMSSRQDRKS